MAAINIDWKKWGPIAIAFYEEGLTFTNVCKKLNELGLSVKPSGVHRFLHKNNIMRSNSAAQIIARKNGSHDYEASCSHCKKQFIGAAGNQKWCKECVPDDISYHRIMRYGLSKIDLDEILLKQHGHCALCEKTEKLVIDHCHDTNRVRGFLCYGCNIALNRIEVEGWVDLAQEYIK